LTSLAEIAATDPELDAREGDVSEALADTVTGVAGHRRVVAWGAEGDAWWVVSVVYVYSHQPVGERHAETYGTMGVEMSSLRVLLVQRRERNARQTLR